jgi:hypothetical protein
MLVADSRHEMTPVLNELARSCAPYASAATQQGVDYGKLPCTLYIYIRQLLVLNIKLPCTWGAVQYIKTLPIRSLRGRFWRG